MGHKAAGQRAYCEQTRRWVVKEGPGAGAGVRKDKRRAPGNALQLYMYACMDAAGTLATPGRGGRWGALGRAGGRGAAGRPGGAGGGTRAGGHDRAYPEFRIGSSRRHGPCAHRHIDVGRLGGNMLQYATNILPSLRP